MACWPVNIVACFFVAILLLDTLQDKWDVIPYHAGLGIGFTGLYYIFCALFGEDISLAVLFVPAVFVLIFMVVSWLFYNNIQAHQCCVTCSKNLSPSPVPKCRPSPSPSPSPCPNKCSV